MVRNSNPRSTKKALAILVKVFSMLFLAAATCTVVSVISVFDLLANSDHVEGKVVNLAIGNKGTRAPVVQFRTTGGESLELTSPVYTSSAPNVGDSVKVIYRKSNPHDWNIDDWLHLYFWTLLSSIFTVVWAIVTSAIWIARNSVAKNLGSEAL